MNRVVVIGGGAAGMMAAAIASEDGNKVVLVEKNSKLGRKVYITGKGRCNLTNATDVENLLNNTATNPYFLYSSFYTFDSFAMMELMESYGVPLKIERGNRVFPVSDKSSDIIDAFAARLRKNKVEIIFSTKVTEILEDSNKVIGVKLDNGKTIECDKVIVATGGLSYPSTGSTGDGYRFAKEAGHTVTKLEPSLVPLRAKESWVAELQGLSLRNVEANFIVDGKVVYSGFGEMLFTHFGISGPLVLTGSRFLVGNYNREVKVSIDLKPALNEAELDKRILKDFEKYKNKTFKNALVDLLPQKLIPITIKLSGIDENKKVNEITKIERKNLLNSIKKMVVTIKESLGYSSAVITCGGVCVDEIDPSTMGSKKIENLFFAGEVIDVDCYTGGFNLQVAFSTGYLAGKNVSKENE